MQMIIGAFVGFVFSFLVLKRSINKSGYGQLKMCRETCPYFRQVENVKSKSEDDEDD